MALTPFRSSFAMNPFRSSDPFFRDDWQISDPFADDFFRERRHMFGGELMKPIAPLLSSDLVESDNAYTVMVDLPGVDPADLDLSIENNVLVMKAERRHRHEVKSDRVHSLERSYGTVQRRIPLPRNADTSQVQTNFKNGELTVTFPKLQQEPPSSTKLEINTA